MAGFVEGKKTPAPRIALVCDREWLNLRSVIDYGNANPNALQLAGVIVPGGEFDPEIFQIAKGFRDMGTKDAKAIPIVEGNGSLGFRYLSASADFRYLHAPYDATALKNDPVQRKLYCENLADLVESCWPDVIFLSNFKLILDPVFVQRFEGRVINVHPSILPQLKGYRPEARADEGEDTDAAGYTFHMVTPELDGGPTIFQQRVPLDSYDPEQATNMGERAYRKMREEKHRLKIIISQAIYTPRILSLMTSDVPNETIWDAKIVEGKEAFAFEEREDFTTDESHYRRIVFNTPSGWTTMERILEAPPVSAIKTPDVLTEYIFNFRGSGHDTMGEAMRILDIVDAVRSEQGSSHLQTRMLYSNGIRRFSVILPYELAGALGEIGIPYETRVMPVSVSSKREPVSFITPDRTWDFPDVQE